MDIAQGELVRQLDRLEKLVNVAREVSGPPSSMGNAQISINAGGAAVWVAVAACMACLVGLLVGSTFVAVAMSDLNRQTQELRQTNETQQAYINAAFAQPEKDQ